MYYPILLFCLVMFIFSIRSVIMKVLTKKLSTETILILVILINIVLVLLCYLFFFDKSKIKKEIITIINDPDSLYIWPTLFVIGIISVMFRFVYYSLIKNNNLYHVSLLFSTLPVFILIAGYFILNEKITRLHFIAMIFIIIGVILLENENGILT